MCPAIHRPTRMTSITTRPADERQAGAPEKFAGKGVADRQHRQRLRLYAAIRASSLARNLGPKGLVVLAFRATSLRPGPRQQR